MNAVPLDPPRSYPHGGVHAEVGPPVSVPTDRAGRGGVTGRGSPWHGGRTVGCGCSCRDQRRGRLRRAPHGGRPLLGTVRAVGVHPIIPADDGGQRDQSDGTRLLDRGRPTPPLNQLTYDV